MGEMGPGGMMGPMNGPGSMRPQMNTQMMMQMQQQQQQQQQMQMQQNRPPPPEYGKMMPQVRPSSYGKTAPNQRIAFYPLHHLLCSSKNQILLY